MKLKMQNTAIDGVKVLTPTSFTDIRGEFFEAYNKREFEVLGIPYDFVQDNFSVSHCGVIRGLHYQLEPYQQDKLVSCTFGSIFDVAVDLRPNSKTFGDWFGIELSARNRKQLFIPKGFAHGLQALEAGSQACYKLTVHYAPDFERCINPLDPTLAITWPLDDDLILSPKDSNAPMFSELFD
ncbi:MAG: dTDP-4-dehydrorhamnose 3,5-epimerase [bacterium]|nr:dTDP-4-dehydrorhamnose 3,5-epimerase [bacterium]